MEYVRLGNAGVMVSRICIGAMDFPERCDEQTCQALVDKAVDKGINFFDTADYYAKFRSEEILGKTLAAKRDQVIIATKFWAHTGTGPNDWGASRYHIMKSVENSLRRLRSDRIDLIQVHHPDPRTPVEEVLSTLDALVKQGKVRYIGVANHFAWQVAHMLGVCALHNWEPIVSLQCRYCLTDRPVENETLPFCRRFNIAALCYGPLEGGLLTGTYKRGEPPPKGSRADVIKFFRDMLTDEMYDVIDAVREVAEKSGATMSQVAVKWLLSRPGVTCPIVGGSKPEHFDPMYELDKVQVEKADLDRLTALTESRRRRDYVNQPIVDGAPLASNWW
jgi:aryl-alcohol dehydrogenase-like predicted oxidoreductase